MSAWMTSVLLSNYTLLRPVGRLDAYRYHRLAPVHAQHGLVPEHDGEVERERLHVHAALWRHVEPDGIRGLARVRLMKHVRRATQDERPRAGRTRQQPHGILAGFDFATFDQDVAREAHSRGRIGAGMPAGAPLHERGIAEQRASPRDGTPVDDRNVRERNGLIDTRPLTGWIPLRGALARPHEHERNRSERRTNAA